MRTYLVSEAGFIEKPQWTRNCWVNVVCPDEDDLKFLTQDLKIPEEFFEDISDTDERPRTETSDKWRLTILRIPMQSDEQGVPFTTVPIGHITKDDVMVTVCYHQTEIISDFIQHTRKRNITPPA